MSIADLPHAELKEVAVNEIALDQKQEGTSGQPSLDDPVAFRWGAWANPLGRLKWYIAKLSMDVLRWKDARVHRTEVGFIKLAIDELIDNDGQPVPMVALFLTGNTTGSSDEDQQPVAIFTRRGIRFLAPVTVEAGINTTVNPRVTRFYTDHGRFFINWQDDTGGPTGIIYDDATGRAVGKIPIEYFQEVIAEE